MLIATLVPISMALTMIGVHLNSAPILWMSIGFGLCNVCVGIINVFFEKSLDNIFRICYIVFNETKGVTMLDIKYDFEKYEVFVENRCYAFEKGKKKELLHLLLNDFPDMTEEEFDSLYMFFITCDVKCK